MPRPLNEIIGGARPADLPPMRASALGPKWAEQFGASLERERNYDQAVEDEQRATEAAIAQAQRDQEVRREQKRRSLEQIRQQAAEIQDSAMLDYGRVTGRGTAKDASGRVVPALDDVAWQEQQRKLETDAFATAKAEREKTRKAEHEARVKAAELEEKRFGHQLADPALSGMADTDRRKLEEEVQAKRTAAVAGLLPEVEKRIEARDMDPEAKRLALEQARMGQIDADTMAELERDLPDAFAGERDTRAKLAADDEIRRKRSDLEAKRHQAAGTALEMAGRDPLAIETPGWNNSFEAEKIRIDRDQRHADLATRSSELETREKSLGEGYQARVEAINTSFQQTLTTGRHTQAQIALLTAQRNADLIRAQAELERGRLALAPDRAKLKLDLDDFDAYQRKLTAPRPNATPAAPATQAPAAEAAPDPAAPAPATPKTPATPAPAGPVDDAGIADITFPDGRREVEVSVGTDRPAGAVLARAEEKAREAGAQTYIRPDAAEVTPDFNAPPPKRLEDEEVETLRTRAQQSTEAAQKAIEEAGTTAAQAVAAGKMDDETARQTFEARQAEALKTANDKLGAVQQETFDAVFQGRMSLQQARRVMESVGVNPDRVDSFVAEQIDGRAKLNRAARDLEGAYAANVAPQRDLWATAERMRQKNIARVTGQEGISGFGRLLADVIPQLRVLNIARDTTGILGGDRDQYIAEQSAARQQDIQTAIDQTLDRNAAAADAILAQYPDLDDATATRMKLTAARSALAKSAVGFEEVAAKYANEPMQMMPFVGDLVGAAVEMGPVIAAAQKARRGEELNETDEFFLEQYISQSGRDHSPVGLAAEILAQAPAFMTEVGLTGGVGTAAKKGLAKGAIKMLGAEAVEGIEKWAAKRAVTRAGGALAGSLIGTTAQTPFAMADKIAADILTRTQVPGLEGFDGDTAKWIAQPGQGFGRAALGAGFDSWVEMVSETAGGLLRIPSGLRNRLAKASWVRAAAKLNPAYSPGMIGKIARRTQLHGPIGEIFEERVGDVLRGVAYEASGGKIGEEFFVGVNPANWKWPTADQWAGEAIGMFAMNGGFAAVNAVATSSGKKAARRLFEEDNEQVAAFGDWRSPAQVAEAMNGMIRADPRRAPFTAKDIEDLEAQIGPLADLPAVQRIFQADQRLAAVMDRADAMDDLETLGRAAEARYTHNRTRTAAVLKTIDAHRQAKTFAARLEAELSPSEAAMVSGGQKIAAGRPLAELTAAERSVWMPQPKTLPDGTVMPAPVLIEEVNGRPIVTDAGKGQLRGILGEGITELLLPMPESKARRLALNPTPEWTPKPSSSSAASPDSASRPASSPPSTGATPASTVGTKTTWRARGENGTTVEIPADAAVSLDDAESKLAALLPDDEMLVPDSVEPPSVRQRRDQEAGADEIPGLDPNAAPAGEQAARPLDHVRRQFGDFAGSTQVSNLGQRAANRVIDTLERIGAGTVFEAVEFTASTKTGMEVTADGKTLRVNPEVLAQQARGPEHFAAVVIEEVIHSVAVQNLEAEKVEALWRALPGKLKQMVTKAYRYNEKAGQEEINDPATDPAKTRQKRISDFAMGHEFLRMVVQDRGFRSMVSEAMNADPSFGFSQKLLDILADLVAALRRYVSKLDKAQRAEVEGYVETILSELEAMGVGVQRTEPGPETPPMTRPRERGITPGADQAGTGAQRITADEGTTPAPATREPRLLGSTGTAYTSTGEPIEFQWAVVEAGDPITSHTNALSPNPVYDQTLQGRNRDSAASAASISDIKGNTIFARLSDASTTADGAPFLGPDMMVESGNGRMIALRLAWGENRPNVQTYRQELIGNAARYGFDPAAVETLQEPTLVRIRRTEVDRVAFAEDANRPTVARLSERETALQDARNLSPSVLEQLEVSTDGDLYTPANREFFRQFFRLSVSTGELPGLVDAEGRLTKAGLDRVRNAVFVSAYGSDPVAMRIFERLVEEVDPDQRNVVNAMVAAAPEVARLRAQMAAGNRAANTFPEDLVTAAGDFLQARAEGTRIEDFLAQGEMFAAPRSPEQVALIRFFDANIRSGRRISTGIRNVLRSIDALGDPREGSLFGDTTAPDMGRLVEDALAREALIGSEVQAEMALAMGAPSAPARELPARARRYLQNSIERYFQRIEATPGELDRLRDQVVQQAFKEYRQSETPTIGSVLRTVLPRFFTTVPTDIQNQIARLVTLRILVSQDYDAQFQASIRDISADGDGYWFPLSGPVKKLARSVEKAVEEWGEATRDGATITVEQAVGSLKDLVRASVIVQDAAEFSTALESIVRRFKVQRVKDRWNHSPQPGYENVVAGVDQYRWEGPLKSGYADILVNVETPTGTAEIQLHIPEMLIAKQGWFQGLPDGYRPVEPLAQTGHEVYEEQRKIAGHIPGAKERIDALDELMFEIYGAALRSHWSRTNSRPPITSLNRLFTNSQEEGWSLKLTIFSSESDPSLRIVRMRLPTNTAGASKSPLSAGSAPGGTLQLTGSLTPKPTITAANIQEFSGNVDVSPLMERASRWREAFDLTGPKENRRLVPIGKLVSHKNELLDPKFQAGLKIDPRQNAANWMVKAIENDPAAKKREPLEVYRNPDGTFTVVDGNATFQAAALAGWKVLPVNVVPEPPALAMGAPDRAADRVYLQVVEQGDLATAQQMVDNVALRRGYRVLGWHGTGGVDSEFAKAEQDRRNAALTGWEARYPVQGPGYYEGTRPGDFDVFTSRNGLYFFSQTQDFANQFRDDWSGTDVNDITGRPGGPGRMIRAYLRIENLFDYRNPDHAAKISDLVETVPSHRFNWMALEKPDVIQRIKDLGFDAMIVSEASDLSDTGGGPEISHNIAVFSPSQIKSAEPVTRDKSGAIIPLSQRFDSSEDSILRMGAPAFQADQFDLFEYQAPDGGIRKIPRTKPAPAAAASDLIFQGNLFDWQPNAEPATLENDGNGTGRPGGRVGTRRPGAATGGGQPAGASERGPDGGETLGDLFAWGGGPSAATPAGGAAGQPGLGGLRGPDRPDGGQSDQDVVAPDGAGDRGPDGGPVGDRPVGDIDAGPSGNGAGLTANEKPILERPTDPAARNFVLPDGFEPSPGGANARIEANFAAIKLLRQLEDEARDATPEEKKVLVRYTGWGSFKEPFSVILYNDAKRRVEEVEKSHGADWAEREYEETYSPYNRGYYGRLNYRPEQAYYDAKAWLDNHGALHERLAAELTPTEFEAAFMSIANAHYTAAPVVDAVWDIARKAGFRGGRAMEPSAGVGHFIGRTPADLADRTQWDAIELDDVTARILGKLYPEARVNSQRPDSARVVAGQGFQAARIPNNSLDLVISNVPFDKDGPGESKGEFGIQFNLHNYFFARALAKVKPGGLVVFITTHNTMDAAMDQRKWLAERSEFVHAVRLPSTAFKKTAGTEVVTDIIVLRKPDGTGKAPVDHDWTLTAEVGEQEVDHTLVKSEDGEDLSKKAIGEALREIETGWEPIDPELAPLWRAWAEKRTSSGQLFDPLVNALAKRIEKTPNRNQWNRQQRIRLRFRAPIRANQFFAANPEAVVGTHTLAGSMYSENEYSVAPPAGGSDAYMEALRRAVELTPEVGQAAEVEAEDVVASDMGDREGSFVERDGRFFQVFGSTLLPMEWKPSEEAVFRSWSRVLATTERLLDLEQNPRTSDATLDEVRARLNEEFDQHVATYGHPSDPNNKTNRHRHLIADSSGFALVQSLESPVKDVAADGRETYTYEKAPLLQRRVLKPIVEPTSAESIAEAYKISMTYRGRIDAAFVGRLLGKSEDSARGELLESGLVYEDPLSGLLVDADEYLSGNVVEKFLAAETAAREDSRYERNARALAEVKPPLKQPSQIAFQIGQTWIPNEVYDLFAKEVLRIRDARTRVESDIKSFSGEGGTRDWGTEDLNAADLFRSLVEMKDIKVYRGRGDDRHFSPEGTEAARAKQEEIAREFSNWVRSTPLELNERVVGEIAADQYNRVVNVLRPPTYKGDWVDLPDQSGEIRLTPHRKSVLARFLTQGFGMMAHGVGSGKTHAQIALAHELKRLGKANKVVIVAMNPTVEQFAASYKQSYPQARLLVANPKGNFDSKRRAQFYSQMATGDFDAIIIPHSVLKQIPHSREAIAAYYDQMVQELNATIAKSVAAGDKKGANKIREKIKKLREQMLKRMGEADKNRDAGAIEWEKMGIDALIVDEAHAFKNAPVVTAMKRIKNIPTGEASDNALSMMLKVSDVQRRRQGRNVFFATGTPITNTMGEAYVMLRYLAPDQLKALEIHSFDDFARNFAVTEENPEATWRGKVQMTKRLSKFVNATGIINLIRSTFDVALGNEKLGLDVPRVKGGRAKQIIVPQTGAGQVVNDWILDIVDSFEALDPAQLREDKQLGAIPIVTMQAGLAAATDPRMIDPNAPDDPDSKVNRMVEEIMRIYEAGAERRTTQAIFTDLRNPFKTKLLIDKGMVEGLPFGGEAQGVEQDTDPEAEDDARENEDEDEGGDNRFDLFEDIKAKLIARGVPASEIWWPTGENAEKLAEQFDKLNEGKVRIVIGGTSKIGTGVNFQERLAAVHHLNPPRDMKPAMMEQRNGRIIRQGNLHAEWAHNAFVAVVEAAAGRKFEGKTPKKRREAAQQWLDKNGTEELREAADAAAAQFDIEIFEYASENSIDSAIFSMMAAKQGFIAQSLSETTNEDEFEDPADEIKMAMAEIAARTMGDPDLIRMVEMERLVKALRIKAQNHHAAIANKRSDLRKIRSELDWIDLGAAARAELPENVSNLFEDPKNQPVWKFGKFTHDPNYKPQKGEKVQPLVGSMERWLADAKEGYHTIQVGPLEVRVTIYDRLRHDSPTDGWIYITGGSGVKSRDLASRRFEGGKSFVQQMHSLVRDIESGARSDQMRRIRLESELADLETQDLDAPFPQETELRSLEEQFAAVRTRVVAMLDQKAAERRERRQAMKDAKAGIIRAAASSAAGVIHAPKVAQLWADQFQPPVGREEGLAMGAPRINESAGDLFAWASRQAAAQPDLKVPDPSRMSVSQREAQYRAITALKAAQFRGSVTDEQARDLRRAFLEGNGTVSNQIQELIENPGHNWNIVGSLITSPEDWFAANAIFRNPRFESLRIAVLDEDARVVSAEVLNIGSNNQAIVDIPRIIHAVSTARAKGVENPRVIISHNHPSGNPDPSMHDQAVTQKIRAALESVGSSLVDHVITNGTRGYSFEANGFFDMLDSEVPWVHQPRETMPKVQSPEDAQGIAAALRAVNDKVAYLMILDNRLRVSAIEQAPADDPGAIRKQAIVSMSAHGSTKMMVLMPEPDPGNKQLARTLKEAIDNVDGMVIDVVAPFANNNPNGLLYSLREQGLMMGAPTRPHLDLEADWSTWPLAEVVMDIAGIPERSPIRPMMRKKPKLAPLEKHAGGPRALERALGEAGIAMGAWHGTPHKVDRFSVSKIGTGEGNQSYGWGLYFAEDKSVAKFYRDSLSAKPPSGDRFRWNQQIRYLEVTEAIKEDDGWNTKAELLALLRQNAASKEDEWGDPQPENDYQLAADLIESGAITVIERDPGNLYRVDIKADPDTDFLDWDKPLSQQSEKVRKGFLKAYTTRTRQNPDELRFAWDISGQEMYDMMAAGGRQSSGREAEQATREASLELLRHGIKGIRYLDANSRGFGPGPLFMAFPKKKNAQVKAAELASQGYTDISITLDSSTDPRNPWDLRATAPAKVETRNFVVFDESLVEILEENGKPVSPAAREEALALAMGAPTLWVKPGEEGYLAPPADLIGILKEKTDAGAWAIERAKYMPPGGEGVSRIDSHTWEFVGFFPRKVRENTTEKGVLPDGSEFYFRAKSGGNGYQSQATKYEARLMWYDAETVRANSGPAMGTPGRGTTPASPTWDDEAAIRSTLDYFANRLPSPAAMDERRERIGRRTTSADSGDLNLEGTPDRVDIRREIAAVRDVQLDGMKSQTHEQWVAEAKRLIETDYDGVVRALLEHAREGEPLPNPALVKAAQIIIPRIWRHAKATGDRADMRDAQALTYAYLEGGTRASYVLGARRDMYKTDAERHVDFLSGIIARVPPAVRKRAERAPTPSQKRRNIEELKGQLDIARREAGAKSAEVEALEARIEKAKQAGKAGLAEIERLNRELTNVKRLHNASVDNAKASIKRLGKALEEARKAKDRAEILGEAHEARLAKVEEVLRGMGLTLHDIFSHQAVVRLRGSEIVARVIEENFSAPQRAAIRFSLPPEGLSSGQVSKRTGVAREAIPGLMANFRQKIEARFMALAKNGLTLADFMASENGGAMFDVTGRIGERGEALRFGTPVTVAQARAATAEMMEALFGGHSSKDAPGKRKPNRVPFKIDNRVHVAQVGTALRAAVDSSAYDMAYEWWINNILSGPQTHAVNITGNALNLALEYGMQRWMEATWNLAIGDKDGATFGEYGPMMRALRSKEVWGKAFQKAREAWLTEESYLEADLLRDPALVGGSEKSGGASQRTAIPGRLGKTVRIPGRALLFMDTFFKGVVARAEVAGMAYRSGRAAGLNGAALESHIRSEVNKPGSASWARAVDKARELTFTQELQGAADGGGLFEQLVKKLQDSRQADTALSPLAAAVVGWFFPFIQTPFNIFKAGLRRTPFGAIGVLSHLLQKGVVSWRHGGPFLENYGKARLARDLTDQTISLLLTSLMWAFTEGDDDDDDKPVLITGSRPYGVANTGERELVDRLEGGAFTIRIGRGPDAIRFDYSRLEPFATVLGSIADSLRSIKRMENGAAKVDELVKFHQYALAQATDKTFLQGIVKMSELMEPGASTGTNVGRTLAQAIVPNLVRQPLRLTDDYVRQSKTAPWWYHAVPLGGFAEPKYDLYGEPIRKGKAPATPSAAPVQRLARIPIDTGLKPAPVPHVADVALRNWNRLNPDKGEQYWPPGNSITSFKDFAGQKRKLTATQLAEVERIGGTRLRVMLAQQITPAEAANPTEATIEKIRAARAKVFGEARDEVVKRPSAPRKKPRSLSEIFGWTAPQ